MCGRFTDLFTWAQLHALYSIHDRPPTNLQPRYNVCPTDTIGVVLLRDGKRMFVPMRWGLVPSWWSKPLKELRLATFNARAETVTTKPLFREAFGRGQRCIVPASGYFEWQDTPDGKQPHYFTRRDEQPISIAGIWDEWHDHQTGEVLLSCAMIITDANDFIGQVHDRMPVILESDQIEAWLSGASGMQVLRAAADDVLRRWPVSKRVNSSRASKEDATLIEPIEGPTMLASVGEAIPDLFQKDR